MLSVLVKCKACEKEIAKGVKKCPNCGKDQRNWFMRHKIMSVLGALIVLIIITNLASGDSDEVDASKESTTNSTASEKAPAKEEKVIAVGDTFNSKQLEFTITKFEELDQIGDPNLFGKKASEGSTLVAIQYTMKNVSDKPVGMFSYPAVNLVDKKGTKYNSDIDSSVAYSVETGIDDSKSVSDLNPDISVTSVEVYEVSKAKFAEDEWFIQIGKAKVKLK
ncbi:DUF4352 domain-containing protein [Sporosarcina sp. A2]|uniref:DUF4352 domain-containing protein n=1 Tax=Sporosarcina sp. A2 TaxID=3393449 RepID=UPI003D7A78CC